MPAILFCDSHSTSVSVAIYNSSKLTNEVIWMFLPWFWQSRHLWTTSRISLTLQVPKAGLSCIFPSLTFTKSCARFIVIVSILHKESMKAKEFIISSSSLLRVALSFKKYALMRCFVVSDSANIACTGVLRSCACNMNNIIWAVTTWIAQKTVVSIM